MNVTLALENGRLFRGRSFGAPVEAAGEVVFNTSLTGYQEILTDPSYCGQIVTMTYPHIGNYGVNDADVESARPQVAALVVHEYSSIRSNWRSTSTLGDYLAANRIPGISGIDTRALVRLIRSEGAMRGVIGPGETADADLVERARTIPSMSGLDLASVVTCRERYEWSDAGTAYPLPTRRKFTTNGSRFRVAVLDYGVKHNILRRLVSYGCALTILPASTTPDEILALAPDGLFLSNGPGDPDAVGYAIENLKRLIGRLPIFGICLGHQLLALALGGRTYKLKFGHRGANHPVKNLLTDEIEITSQNHGFAVDWSSMDDSMVELTHLNLNDKTVEGFRHRTLPLFCVQYHPEASPGPHDSDYLFANFAEMMTARQPAEAGTNR